MAGKRTREDALHLRRNVDTLELENLLKKSALDELRAENDSLRQLRDFLGYQVEDAALRLLKRTKRDLQQREDALRRVRRARYGMCDELRRLIVENVMHRILDVVSVVSVLTQKLDVKERPPTDRWQVPPPVLEVERNVLSTRAFSLAMGGKLPNGLDTGDRLHTPLQIVSRLVDEQLSASSEALSDVTGRSR